MMKLTNERINIWRESLGSFVQAHPEIVTIYLFGSRVTEHYRKDSDWDIGILFDRNFQVPNDRPWLKT